MYVRFAHGEKATVDLGARLAQSAVAGDVICLSGELGAGKTVFASGFAQGLGAKERVTSPTFCIVNEYRGRLPMYHFDAYRTTADDMYDVGFDEYLYGAGVCVIEWAENIAALIPPNALWIDIKHAAGGDTMREVVFNHGQRHE